MRTVYPCASLTYITKGKPMSAAVAAACFRFWSAGKSVESISRTVNYPVRDVETVLRGVTR